MGNATVLLLPKGLLTPLVSPNVRSGLVLGLLFDLKTFLNLEAGDLPRALLSMLFDRAVGRRASALSMRPGIGRVGVESEMGVGFGNGEDSALSGSTSAGMGCRGAVVSFPSTL